MQSRNEVLDEPKRRRAKSLVLIVFQNGKQPKAVQIKKKDKFKNMIDKSAGGGILPLEIYFSVCVANF